MDMMSALHATADIIVKFSTPVYEAIVPVVQRPIKEAPFTITS
jgi:hypothetical protein